MPYQMFHPSTLFFPFQFAGERRQGEIVTIIIMSAWHPLAIFEKFPFKVSLNFSLLLKDP